MKKNIFLHKSARMTLSKKTHNSYATDKLDRFINNLLHIYYLIWKDDSAGILGLIHQVSFPKKVSKVKK